LNHLLDSSDKKSIGIDSIINTIIGEDADDEIKQLVKIALDNLGAGITMKELAEGVMNLYKWRESQC
jgi:hypothetical protein